MGGKAEKFSVLVGGTLVTTLRTLPAGGRLDLGTEHLPRRPFIVCGGAGSQMRGQQAGSPSHRLTGAGPGGGRGLGPG